MKSALLLFMLSVNSNFPSKPKDTSCKIFVIVNSYTSHICLCPWLHSVDSSVPLFWGYVGRRMPARNSQPCNCTRVYQLCKRTYVINLGPYAISWKLITSLKSPLSLTQIGPSGLEVLKSITLKIIFQNEQTLNTCRSMCQVMQLWRHIYNTQN